MPRPLNALHKFYSVIIFFVLPSWVITSLLASYVLDSAYNFCFCCYPKVHYFICVVCVCVFSIFLLVCAAMFNRWSREGGCYRADHAATMVQAVLLLMPTLILFPCLLHIHGWVGQGQGSGGACCTSCYL